MKRFQYYVSAVLSVDAFEEDDAREALKDYFDEAEEVGIHVGRFEIIDECEVYND